MPGNDADQLEFFVQKPYQDDDHTNLIAPLPHSDETIGERGMKGDNIDGNTQTTIKRRQLNDFMSLV